MKPLSERRPCCIEIPETVGQMRIEPSQSEMGGLKMERRNARGFKFSNGNYFSIILFSFAHTVLCSFTSVVLLLTLFCLVTPNARSCPVESLRHTPRPHRSIVRSLAARPRTSTRRAHVDGKRREASNHTNSSQSDPANRTARRYLLRVLLRLPLCEATSGNSR